MSTSHVVRGYGPLDLFLAKWRFKTARKQLKLAQRTGRILDVGCGCYPLFLIKSDFSEKYALDKVAKADVISEAKKHGINFVEIDIEKEQRLPFESDYFDVVSMLAVFEHLDPKQLVRIHKEILRVLKPGGMYIMTTPAVWTDRLLRFLAKLHLISGVEIAEHKGSYNHSMISSILQNTGFQKDKLEFGYFELFMNNWVTATK